MVEREDSRVLQTWVGQLLAPIALIVVVCCAAVAWHVDEHRPIGPLDEQAHFDYLNRLLDGDLPAIGDKLTLETRTQVACRGMETPAGAAERPDCSPPRRLDQVPEEGNSYEAGQPPLYYGVTALLSLVAPGDDVDSLRVVGGLWLAAGAVGLFLALRRLGAALGFAVVATLALALTPPLWFAASVVSNDIAIWTFGGLALWAVVWLMQVPELRPRHYAVAAGVGAAGGLVKPTSLLVVGALGLALVLHETWAGRARSGWGLAAALAVGAVAATGIWGLVATNAQRVPLDQIEPWARFRVDSLHVTDVLRRPLFNLVSPYNAFVSHELRVDWVLDSLFQAAEYVGIGLLLLPLVTRWPDGPARSIGLGYLVAIAISGPYYVILYFLSAHIVYTADARFGLGLLPLLGVLLAVWVARAWQRWTLAALLALPILWYALLLGGAVTPAPR